MSRSSTPEIGSVSNMSRIVIFSSTQTESSCRLSKCMIEILSGGRFNDFIPFNFSQTLLFKSYIALFFSLKIVKK